MTAKLTPETFWEALEREPGGCWLWTRRHWNGYGQVWFKGREWRAHRLAYLLHHGLLPEGKMICHTCDERACCNPDHLYLGTQTENMRDRRVRGRTARGERHGSAKLTADDVRHIRRRYAETGLLPDVLGAEYGVTGAAIRALLRGRSWRHVSSVTTSQERA
jgi:hypothetical protein